MNIKQELRLAEQRAEQFAADTCRQKRLAAQGTKVRKTHSYPHPCDSLLTYSHPSHLTHNLISTLYSILTLIVAFTSDTIPFEYPSRCCVHSSLVSSVNSSRPSNPHIFFPLLPLYTTILFFPFFHLNLISESLLLHFSYLIIYEHSSYLVSCMC